MSVDPNEMAIKVLDTKEPNRPLSYKVSESTFSAFRRTFRLEGQIFGADRISYLTRIVFHYEKINPNAQFKSNSLMPFPAWESRLRDFDWRLCNTEQSCIDYLKSQLPPETYKKASILTNDGDLITGYFNHFHVATRQGKPKYPIGGIVLSTRVNGRWKKLPPIDFEDIRAFSFEGSNPPE
jgi:hypothetical protein